MPVLRMDEIKNLLFRNGTRSIIGDFKSDISESYRPYYERYLGNRDGFLKILNGNIDYVGSEEVMRLGPFYNMYCLLSNHNLMETDLNHRRLLDALPYYSLSNGIVNEFGWSGSILAQRLEMDSSLCREVRGKILDLEVRSISVKVANYACLIESKAWDAAGFVTAYPIIDQICGNIKRLLNDIHLGDDIST